MMEMHERRALMVDTETLVKYPHKMDAGCVNRILTNLQTCLRETLELPSIKLSLILGEVDMKFRRAGLGWRGFREQRISARWSRSIARLNRLVVLERP